MFLVFILSCVESSHESMSPAPGFSQDAAADPRSVRAFDADTKLGVQNLANQEPTDLEVLIGQLVMMNALGSGSLTLAVTDAEARDGEVWRAASENLFAPPPLGENGWRSCAGLTAKDFGIPDDRPVFMFDNESGRCYTNARESYPRFILVLNPVAERDFEFMYPTRGDERVAVSTVSHLRFGSGH